MKKIVHQTLLRNMVLAVIPALIIAVLFSFDSAQKQRQDVLDARTNKLTQFGSEIEILTSQLENFALSQRIT